MDIYKLHEVLAALKSSYMRNFKNKTVVIDSIFITMDPFAISYLSCIGNDNGWEEQLVISLHLHTWASHHDRILFYIERGKATALTNMLIKSDWCFNSKNICICLDVFLDVFFCLCWWMHTLKYMRSLTHWGKALKMQILRFLKLDVTQIFDSEYLDIYPKGTHSHCLLS